MKHTLRQVFRSSKFFGWICHLRGNRSDGDHLSSDYNRCSFGNYRSGNFLPPGIYVNVYDSMWYVPSTPKTR